jgi:hypothetical protein
LKTIIIKRFKAANANRIGLIQALVSYNSTIGLKHAKDKIDSMVSDRIPIEYSIDDEKLDKFIKNLDQLNLEYEIN